MKAEQMFLICLQGTCQNKKTSTVPQGRLNTAPQFGKGGKHHKDVSKGLTAQPPLRSL